jgi:hypothetical protein
MKSGAHEPSTQGSHRGNSPLRCRGRFDAAPGSIQRLRDPGADYFDELLARIRDIRASEKVFYKKVLEIYATSIDYDARAEASALFFKTVDRAR